MIETSISISDIIQLIITGSLVCITAYYAYQIKKQRQYEQLPYLSCKVKSSVFRIEGNKELKGVFTEPLIIQVKNIGRAPAVQIYFRSDFEDVQIPDLNPRETYDVRLPTGEEILKIDTGGEFDIIYGDIYLNKKSVVYTYSLTIFDGEMKLEEISRNSIKIQ